MSSTLWNKYTTALHDKRDKCPRPRGEQRTHTHTHKTLYKINKRVLPVQNDVIKCPPLNTEHVWIHGTLLGLLHQQTHVIGDQPLKERACLLPLNLHDGPVRQMVTHKLSAGILPVSRGLAVPLDTEPWQWQRRCALTESSIVSDLSGVTTGVRESPSDQTQKKHGLRYRKGDLFSNWVSTRPLDRSGRLHNPNKCINCHRFP